MAFLVQRFVQSALMPAVSISRSQLWDTPEKVTLPVIEGATPNNKSPVRIFLGTERAQYKAERIFIWSIEQVRDPARVYEIYLMKNLKGFRSRFWLTGFTNYRFAIPAFMAGKGLAIYNDVDQIYQKDPGELFDLPMAGHGYLAISPGDISVSLIDCKKMSQVWTLDDARKLGKNVLLARAENTAALWGALGACWNVRDDEHVTGESGVLHYTALHRQPWHPFPGKFVYQKNPDSEPWYKLEQSANEAGFRVFDGRCPSRGFTVMQRSIIEQNRTLPLQLGDLSADGHRWGLSNLLREYDCQSLLVCQIDSSFKPSNISLSGRVCSAYLVDPVVNPQFKECVACDAVICTDTFERLPDDDIPWLLRNLFAHAGVLLFCVVRTYTVENVRTPEWWRYHFEIVARQFPKIHWRIHIEHTQMLGMKHRLVEGNECCRRTPQLWVLNDHKPGHNSQANAIAEMIGWNSEVKLVQQKLVNLLPVLCNLAIVPAGLKAPWPDVIVACGWWPCHVARYLKARSAGRIRLVLSGRKNGGVKSVDDIAINCEHFHLPANHRRIETLLPLHPLTNTSMQDATTRGDILIAGKVCPVVALFIGGTSQQYQFPPEDAVRLGQRVLEQVKSLQCSLVAVTSRRTDERSAAALQKVLASEAEVYIWKPGKADNPYLEYLASADILIVTGESESMLTDAVSTGKPTYIYPLRRKTMQLPLAIGGWLLNRSVQKLRNRRGTERPQQGLEYLCARILQKEWILPPRDLEDLHKRLVVHGYAKMFDDNLDQQVPASPYVQPDLGPVLRQMLGQSKHEGGVVLQDYHLSKGLSA